MFPVKPKLHKHFVDLCSIPNSEEKYNNESDPCAPGEGVCERNTL